MRELPDRSPVPATPEGPGSVPPVTTMPPDRIEPTMTDLAPATPNIPIDRRRRASPFRKIDSPARRECGLHADDCPTTRDDNLPCDCQNTERAPTVADAIITAIRLGQRQNTAAAWAGIWPATLSRWITRGNEELGRMGTENQDTPQETEEPYVTLALELAYTDADAQMRAVAEWQNHFPKDWRAIDRFMAKRWPDQWADHTGGSTSRLEITGTGGGPVQVSAGVMGLDEAFALVAEVAARSSVQDAAIEGSVVE